MNDAEKRFEEYIKRFCDKHDLSREEATKHRIVQEYWFQVLREYKDDIKGKGKN